MPGRGKGRNHQGVGLRKDQVGLSDRLSGSSYKQGFMSEKNNA
jgi:hypothetical protein